MLSEKVMIRVKRRGKRFLTCSHQGQMTSYNDPSDVRVAASRYAAALKSPEILASKERLRLNRRDKAIARRVTPMAEREMAEREPIGYVAGVRPSHT